MRKVEKKKFITGAVIILRIGFGLLLCYAAIDKIRHPLQFAGIVENYRVFNAELSFWVAAIVPYLEVITGFLLISAIWIDAASMLNMLFMCLFFILVTQAYLRGLDIHCGCFSTGEEGEPIGLIKVSTNLFYMIMSIILLIIILKKGKENPNALHEGTGQERS
jgi:uncharacterized membrane protein YphA (DoxX/SURF4 family)